MEVNSLHKILKRQINRHLTPDCLEHDRFQQFIQAVNESYLNFDRDKELLEHSASLNEREYTDINEKLKEEVSQRRQSVDKLIESIHLIEVPEGEPIADFDTNNLVGLVGFLQRQIEYRKTIEDELRSAKEVAENATQAKSDFLSMMSHEIRTPLNGIVGMTYLMMQEEVPPALTENLKTLQFSIEHLQALINDILDFSKIEAGKVELEEVNFDLKHLVSNIKRAQQAKAQENGNRIRLMIDDDIPDTLIGDSLRIGQVLTNLVSNAIKFTHKGTITIELSLEHRTEEHASIYVSVQDTGIGIAPDKQEAIFTMFTQANSATTRKFGGTGLGLVITKKLLELHGSPIHIESEEGKGATFSFTLNLPISQSAAPLVSTPDAVDNKTLRGLKILLVEDYPVNVKVALKFLTMWGIEVDTAENGLLAVNKCHDNRFDLVLMDLQMPVMDGYTAAQEIRKINGELPIIALTASATFSNKDRAVEVGMVDYVTKPFNPKDLFSKIAKYSQRQISV
ncbi:ATP-binding protein [Spirosoma endbachense]|uniref:histidine kinase n=1 Tax=Spirosoma endbachense TaxID=2666025 RepID=A0A6P1W931_9BACT|nr:ATP-binding protein [Spirosoma endbachense]QHW00893.1 response regulator [Spirosoma endbachense]